MKKLLKILAILTALLLCLTACGVDITSIGLPDELTLDKGGTEQLTVSYGTEDEATEEKIAEAAAKLTLVWTSGDESVATVSETGLVTAVAAGEADITVSIDGANVQSICHVTVKVPLMGVEATESLALVINGDDFATIETTVNPDDATDVTVKFESSDPEVATVDSTGKVTAVAAGECVVTTTAMANGKEVTAETAITVKIAPAEVVLEKTEGVLTIGNTYTLGATITPEEVSEELAELVWASSDESIATVDETGKISAVGIGSATITVSTSNGLTASYELTVQNIKCSYCGQEGHTSGNCAKKQADDAAAAAAAQQAAAAAAAAQAAGGGAAAGGDAGGSSGGGASGGGYPGELFEAVPGGGQTIIEDGSAPIGSGAGGDVGGW